MPLKTNLHISNTNEKKSLGNLRAAIHGILNPIFFPKKKVVKNQRNMRTRRGLCYPGEEKEERKRQSNLGGNQTVVSRKRPRKLAEKSGFDLFNTLPDDLVLSILAKLSSSVSSPSEFINILLTYVAVKSLSINMILTQILIRLFGYETDVRDSMDWDFIPLCYRGFRRRLLLSKLINGRNPPTGF